MPLRKIKQLFAKAKHSHSYAATEPPYTHCKNCGYELHGKYCSVCGQFAHMDNRPFTDSVKFYLEHHYALDHKLGHTLYHLFFRPSFLTREFMNGKIERYVHPFKLYIFSSILLFTLVVALPSRNKAENTDKPIIENAPMSPEAQQQISDLKKSLKQNAKTLNATQVQQIRGKLDSLEHSSSFKSNSAMVSITSDKGEDTNLEKKILTSLATTSQKELTHRFIHNLSLAMLLLMPLFGALLMLFYRKRERFYTAHLIHSVHLHVVLFIGIALSSIWSYFMPSVSIGLWVALYWLLYFFASLFIFYGGSKRKAVAKGVALLFIYLLISVVAVAGVGFLSIIL